MKKADRYSAARRYKRPVHCAACPRRIRYSRPVIIDGRPYGPTCARRELRQQTLEALTLPALAGSPKQVAWAAEIRQDLRAALPSMRAAVRSGRLRWTPGTTPAYLEAATQRILRTADVRFWIDSVRPALRQGDVGCWTLVDLVHRGQTRAAA